MATADAATDDDDLPDPDDLHAFQRDLLVVLAGSDRPAGVAVKDELADYYDRDVHHGSLYPNLADLIAKGLVVKGERDGRTNWYDLTDAGREWLQARRAWEDEQTAGGGW